MTPMPPPVINVFRRQPEGLPFLVVTQKQGDIKIYIPGVERVLQDMPEPSSPEQWGVVLAAVAEKVSEVQCLKTGTDRRSYRDRIIRGMTQQVMTIGKALASERGFVQ